MRITNFIRFLTLIYLLSCFGVRCVAQQKPLGIGDTLPNTAWRQQHRFYDNKAIKTETLTNYQGKPLILDFWASWCGICLGMMPKLDSLQQNHKGQLNIVAVSYQKENELLPFLKQHYRGQTPQLNYILGDTQLKAYFPYRELPHYVWIDANGKVKAITGPQELTSDNLKAFLTAQPLAVEEKIDVIMAYSRETPLFSHAEFNMSLTQQSSLSPNIEGIAGGFNQNVNRAAKQGAHKISVYNASIPYLYAVAYGRGKELLNPNRIRLKVADTNALITHSQGNAFKEWMRQNAHCYELLVNANLKEKAWDLMVADLDRYFPQYKVAFKPEKVMCYALVRTKSFKGIGTRGEASQVKMGRGAALLQNAYLKRFINEMNLLYQQYAKYPLVDATGITEAVDLKLACNLSNMDEVNAELAAYGLTFKAQKHLLPIITITDIKK